MTGLKGGNRLPGKGGRLLCFAAMAALAIGATADLASAITFTGSDANGRSAQAGFTFDGAGNLKVTLTNTATFQTPIPVYVLTALFFDLTGTPALTPTNALLAPGSHVYLDNVLQTEPTGGVVGGEWAYARGFVQYDANEGVSSSGLGLFGSANFPGTSPLPGGHDQNAALDGLDYGIIGTGGTSTQNLLKKTPLIKNAVEFYLGGVPLGPDPVVSHVFFQYGTALDEGHFGGTGSGGNDQIPEPVTLMGVLLGIAGLCRYVRRRVA